MARKKSYLTITDQFCGAGGSSIGAKRIMDQVGGEVKLALNHWKLAIETHNTNFPNTLHDCTDISAADPRRYPSTDILITSPECTTHSPAGGNNHKTLKKQMDMFDSGAENPATARSRATMWDVCRFAEYHQYRCIIVENVVEAKTRWALFDIWLTAMHALGYNHRLVFMNSMHAHPTPQSRDRMYIVFWKKGQKAPMLDHTPAAHCPKCKCDVSAVQTWKDPRKNWGKYGKKNGQYVYCCPKCSTIIEPYYYAAFNCIDWSDIGERIGARKKKLHKKAFNGEHLLPLAANTLNRIQYGLEKFGNQPMIVNTAYGKEARGVTRSIFEAGFTHSTQPGQAIINPPFLIDDKQTTGVSFRTRSILDTNCAVHTDPRVKLIFPPSFLIDSAYEGRPRHISESKRAQTGQHTEGIVTMPIIVENKGKSKARPATSALPTQACKGTHGLLTSEAWNSFINYHYKTPQASGINEPIGTIPTKDNNTLITYQTPGMEDCYYRMLKPPEIKLAMAFDKDYIVLGSGKDQVKQLGNAVTPPAMEWLVQQVVKSLS